MSLWLVLLQLLGCCLPALPAGLIVVENWLPPIRPPGPIPPPWHPRPHPYVFAPLEVTSLDVKTRIKDQVAVTLIEQAFHNPNPVRLEGTFMCPLPKGAQIDKFTLEIDGKPCEAELLKGDKARKIYEDIVRSLKDPALLEYAGRDLVKIRIFPIEPGSTRRITLKYTELLKSDDGLISYVLPLSTEKFSSRPVPNVTVKVELETTRPIKSVYSPTHAIEIKRSDATHATAMLEASGTAAPADFALYFAPEKKEIGLNLLTFRKSGEDGYFLLLASPGVDVKDQSITAKDVAFVVDTSGSMAGKKLEQAKKAFEFCIENLNDKDRFQVIRFSTEVESFFDALVPATKQNRDKALDFARNLRPMGGTAIDDALKQALKLRTDGEDKARPFFVIFLTDGRPTVGTTGEDEIVANVKKLNESRHRVFCVGIGTDVNTHLLDKITEETRAFSQYVLPEEDLEVKLSSFYAKIKEPVLANPTLKVSGNPRVSKLYPSDLPDLFKGQQVVVAGRYSGNGDGAITIEGTVNGAARKFTYEEKFPESSDAHEFLPRLWATRRVGWLLDEIRLRGESAELRDEVTELARRYGIVTPYTSYLIVEDERRRNVAEENRSLRRLDADAEAQEAGRQVWKDFGAKNGLAAASAARESQLYKSANAPAAATAGGAIESSRAMGLAGGSLGVYSQSTASPELKTRARLAAYSQQAQFIGGKTFFLNDGQWVDSTIQDHPKARVVQLKFGSTEYFELSRTHPEALPWLALGGKVRFFLSDTIYEVTEATE